MQAAADVLELEVQVLEKHAECLSSRIWTHARTHADIERDMQRDAFAFGKLAQEKRKLNISSEGKSPGSAAESGSSGRRVTSIITISELAVVDAFSASPFVSGKQPLFAQSYGLRLLISAAEHSPSLILSWPNVDAVCNGDDHALVKQSVNFLRAADSGALFLTAVRSARPSPTLIKDDASLMRAAHSNLLWERSLLHSSRSMTLCHVVLPHVPPPVISVDKYVGQVVSAALTFGQSRPITETFDVARDLLLQGCNRVVQESSDKWKLASAAASRHALLLHKGLGFTLDVLDKYGIPLHAREVATQVKECLRLAIEVGKSSSAASFSNVFKCSLISQDFLLGQTDGSKRRCWAQIRSDIAAVQSNVFPLHLLESSLLVVCLDDDEAGTTIPAQCFSPDHSPPTYPWRNRWLYNALNIAISRSSGQVTLISPTTLVGCGGDGLSDLAAHMVEDLSSKNELYCAEAGHDEWYQESCVAWSASLVCRQLSYIPGKVCHSMFLDQLAVYATELHKITADVDDRKALEVASTYMNQSIAQKNSAALEGVLRQLARNFILAHHPTIKAPIVAAGVSDPEVTAALTVAMINPLLLVERIKKIDTTAASEDDLAPVREPSADERQALALESLRELAPGLSRQATFDALELFQFSLLDVELNPVAFFTEPVPSKDAQRRRQIITAAGSIGFALPQNKDAGAAFAEAQIKRSFNKAMYLLEDDLSKLSPWASTAFWSSQHVTPTTRMKLNIFEAHAVARRVSRVISDRRFGGSGGDDAALLVRYAHRGCVMKAMAALSFFLALLHVGYNDTAIPPCVDDEAGKKRIQASLLSSLPIHHDVNGSNIPLSMTRSAGGGLGVVTLLYTRYIKPRLLGVCSAKDAVNEDVLRCASDALCQLMLHHYAHVSVDDLACVGHVPATPGDSDPNFTATSSEPPQDRISRIRSSTTSPLQEATFATSARSYLDALDSAARVVPSTLGHSLPVTIQALNDASSPLGYDRVPQLTTVECVINDFCSDARDLTTAFSHTSPVPAQPSVIKSSTVSYWVRDKPTAKSEANVAKLLHPLQLHDCEVEMFAAFQNRTFQDAFLRSAAGSFQELAKLFS